MASITASTGLASGIDIAGTVDALMAIEAIPRDNLETKISTLEEEQVAITTMSVYLYAVQSIVTNLAKEDLYDKMGVTSSNEASMLATVSSDALAKEGSYTFTTLQTSQNEQWLSSGVVDSEASLGGGEFSFRFGDNLERDLPLQVLNDGDGIERGVIRITDRSGAWADIDLTAAQTMDDVIDAISSNLSINVTAEAYGDGIRLIDDTGRADVNLLVQEVSGSTAASLGLDGINAAASTAQGEDLVSLFDDLALAQLNDGNGISFASDFFSSDIDYTLADGTTGTIDFTPAIDASTNEAPPATLGELIERFNEADPGKLEMSISADGKRLEVTDLTAGDPDLFELTSNSISQSQALEDLGLTGEAVAGVITGRRLIGGTGTVLVSTLNGGSTGTLGSIDLTDRSGATTTVDLSGAETVEEVLDAINASGLDITAELNDAKNGITLTDTSGATASNLIVASADATDTAALLGITADTEETTIESGDLHQQIISENTLLDDLNGGAGIARGNITIRDRNGATTVLALADPTIVTVGDLIEAAATGSANVTLQINPDGDGILIKDNSTGSGTLEVLDNAKGTAADLNWTGDAEEMEVDGETVTAIKGSSTHVIELEEGDSLEDLTDMINEIAGGATASIFNDGSIRPYRMVLNSDQTGLAGAMVLDTSSLGISFNRTAEAKDAIISLGEPDSGILISSSNNTFDEVVDGLSIEVYQASSTATTLTVDRDVTDFLATMQVFVTNYNLFRESYNDATAYNPETQTGSILTGDATAKRVNNELGMALTDRYVAVGDIQTIRELGIKISSNDGSMTLDEDLLTERFNENPEAVKEFFTSDPGDDENESGYITLDDLNKEPVVGARGFAVALNDTLDSLVEADVSLLARRYSALDTKITNNEDHLEFLDERLEAKREYMLWKFYYMELAIAKMQSFQNSIDSLSLIGMDGDSGKE